MKARLEKKQACFEHHRIEKNIRKKDKGDKMNLDPNTTKYLIKADITADGVVEKPDVVGAIFGQTEGLLGEELDLRDLQKGGRIGRIEVDISSSKGRSEGSVEIPSSLDQVETAILASAWKGGDYQLC